MKAAHGFTLAETFIVIVIVGIAAALAIPQYSSAAVYSRTAALTRDLQIMRDQIDAYRSQHHQALPATVGEGEAEFVRRLTTKTDVEGAPGNEFGPYLERIPANPFNRCGTVRIGGAAAGVNTHGWRFDPITGMVQADDNYDGNADGALDHVKL